MSDQGAIYMGRDPSEAGNVFRYNFFHDISTTTPAGTGCRRSSSMTGHRSARTISGNVFYKTGNTGVVKFYGGGENPIVNNIVVDCPKLLQAQSTLPDGPCKFMSKDLGHERCFKTVNVTKPPYSERYPVLCAVALGEKPVGHPLLRNYVVNGDDSQFVDAEKLDFTLKADSKVYQEIEGFEKIPFGKIGLYKDEYR